MEALCPTPTQILEMARSARKGRAVGEDAIPMELILAMPEAVLRHVMPLIAKVYSSGQQPLEWKGGILQELLKAGKPPEQACSNRGVILENHLGEFPSRQARALIAPKWQNWAVPEQ